MFAFFTITAFLFASPGAGGESGFTHFYNQYFNIPGFELWKFINLGIFLAIMIWLVKKPLGDAFKAKRDSIRAELIKAEAEKQAALNRLTAAEAKLAQLETEKANILRRAEEEAEFERKRQAEALATEIERLRKQTDAELARVAAQSRAELRRFSADEAIRLAEAKLRDRIDSDSDARLVRGSIQEIGGLN